MHDRRRMSFEQLIAGQHSPWWGAIARAGLQLAQYPYRWAAAWRNRRYDSGRATIHHVGVPVVSVGNITAGGTGKTPLVAWLGAWYRQRGLRVVFISRGYKATDDRPNDEARELQQRLPDVPHIQDPDRVTAAQQAIDQYQADIIILDDAFQHRRIHRDLDIVLIDALRPFGYRHLLPRGLLREPLENLARADVIGLSRADAIDEAARQALHDTIASLAPTADYVELCHAPRCLISHHTGMQDPNWLQEKCVVAFCGIGNPTGFRSTLEQLGCHVLQLHTFPDHHHFVNADLDRIAQSIRSADRSVHAVVCTHKDFVKISQHEIAGIPLLAVDIEIDVRAGQDRLEQQLKQLIAARVR